MLGTTLGGRYEIEKVIGQGGFAIVYKARQISIDRNVAVKVLTLDASQDESIGRRFEGEAKIISQLRHPNTLKLIDFGQTEDNRIYLVMELLEGSALDDLLTTGPLPPRAVVSIIRQSAAALEEAHDLGVVHRDIKPGNIFVEKVGRREVVKVLDFGIAKVHSQQSHTMTGQMFGTPLYMSPEQVKGLEVDGRSDLYSLGVVAYQCLTGDVPFNGTTPYSILMKHANDAPPPMLSVNPAMIHSELEALVMGLLAKDPDERIASAGDLIDELDHLDIRLKQAGEPDPHRSGQDSLGPAQNRPIHDKTIVVSPSSEISRPASQSTGSPPRTMYSESGHRQHVEPGQKQSHSDAFELPAEITKKSKTGWIGILAAAICIGLGIFVYMNSTSKPAPNTAAKPAVAPQMVTKKQPADPVKKSASSSAKPTPAVDAHSKTATSPSQTLKTKNAVVQTPSTKKSEKKNTGHKTATKISAKTVPKKVSKKASKKITSATKIPSKKRTKLKPRKRVRPTPSRPKVVRVKVVLTPRKAVYELEDRPRIKAIAYGANGQALKGKQKVSWSITGPAKKKGGTLRFLKEGKGQAQACINRVCGKARFMGLDSSGLP